MNGTSGTMYRGPHAASPCQNVSGAISASCVSTTAPTSTASGRARFQNDRTPITPARSGVLSSLRDASGAVQGWTFQRDQGNVAMPVDVSRVESDARAAPR